MVAQCSVVSGLLGSLDDCQRRGKFAGLAAEHRLESGENYSERSGTLYKQAVQGARILVEAERLGCDLKPNGNSR
jgi:hypothetical protein